MRSRLVALAAVLALLDNPRYAGASRQATATSCGWVVHYDRWLPPFAQKGPYDDKPGDSVKLSGTHCLEACCRDPTCTGVALESSLEYQCYKYAKIPDDLNDPSFSTGESLVNFLTKPREPAWSIFIKSTPGGAEVMPPAMDALARRAAAAVPEPSAAKLEASIDARLRGSLYSNQKCGWAVSYDKWVPSFQRGEYEHNDINGGVHCLEACCQDPTCVGVTLESNEMYQCYKYANKPVGLPKEQRALGDGKWLVQQRPAWSVFMKQPLGAALPAPAAKISVPQSGPLRLSMTPAEVDAEEKAEDRAEETVAAKLQSRAAQVGHSLSLFAMVAVLISTSIYALSRVELVAKKLAKNSLARTLFGNRGGEGERLLCETAMRENLRPVVS